MPEKRPDDSALDSPTGANPDLHIEERVSERTFTQQVIDEAEYHGWATFHLRDRDSIHIVRGKGFPDLVMHRPVPGTDRSEMIVSELKRGYDIELRKDQVKWLSAFGHYVYAREWRPSDWPEIERVLRDGPSSSDIARAASPRRRVRSGSQIPMDFGLTIKGLWETIEDKDYDKGAAASLRRLNPNDPGGAAFWRLMSRKNMPSEPDVKKWGLIINGMALMAHGAGRAHSGIPVGRALYQGDGKRASSGWYSENRLSTLLGARGPMLHRLAERLFRMLASAGCSFNWREMAWFILNEGVNEREAEKSRIGIAREYYQAERRNSSDQNNEETGSEE